MKLARKGVNKIIKSKINKLKCTAFTISCLFVIFGLCNREKTRTRNDCHSLSTFSLNHTLGLMQL